MSVRPWILALLAQKASQRSGGDADGDAAGGDDTGASSNGGCSGLSALFGLLALDAALFVVAWFAWMVYWPVAIVFSLPFVALTLIIVVQLIRPRQA